MIRYTSFSPADVVVDYRLHGRQGVAESSARRTSVFAKRASSGSPRGSPTPRWSKVRAARRFAVSMAIPEAPRYCRRYDTRHLTIKRTVHNQAVWFQSDSIFGP